MLAAHDDAVVHVVQLGHDERERDGPAAVRDEAAPHAGLEFDAVQHLLTTVVDAKILDVTDREHLIDEMGTRLEEDAAARRLGVGLIPIPGTPRMADPGALAAENRLERPEDARPQPVARQRHRGVVPTDEADTQTHLAPSRLGHDPFVVLQRRGERLLAERMPAPREDLLERAPTSADRDGDEDGVHVGTLVERPEDVRDAVGRGQRPGAGPIRVTHPRDLHPGETREHRQVERLHDIARTQQAHADHSRPVPRHAGRGPCAALHGLGRLSMDENDRDGSRSRSPGAASPARSPTGSRSFRNAANARA